MMVLVMFNPKISEEEIRKEAVRMHELQEESEGAHINDTHPPLEPKEPVRITIKPYLCGLCYV